jgi:hypothetical protein
LCADDARTVDLAQPDAIEVRRPADASGRVEAARPRFGHSQRSEIREQSSDDLATLLEFPPDARAQNYR